MENSRVKLGRRMYAICIICFGIQQAAYGYISPNFVPIGLKDSLICQLLAYPWCIAFILSGIAFLFDKKAYEVALISGGVFLGLFGLVYLPYLSFVHDKSDVFFEWAPSFMAIAFAGASFIFAGSFNRDASRASSLIIALERLKPLGGVFYSVMLVGFGAMHFVYAKGVAMLVPNWIPLDPVFWTYFTGVALVGAGAAISLRIKLKLVALLYGAMVFSWFLFIHIGRAIENPTGAGGLELTRVFVTFGWTGIALVLAFSGKWGGAPRQAS